ncbi:MAG: radical SAM protein [Pseudomonadota bacterium]
MKQVLNKIIFLEPKSPGSHVYSKWGLPRLGTVQLATILKNAGYDALVYVEDYKGIDFEDVLTADAVGISTITSTAPRAYEMARQARLAGIPVFMGGPHVSFLPKEALKHCDFVLRGEAEETIIPFIEALNKNSGFENVAGLSYNIGKIYHENPLPTTCPELDSLPDPDLTLIKGKGIEDKDLSVTPVITSRGCPFGCNFCSVTQMFGRRYRFRSTQRVIAELKAKKPEWVFFYDDNFAANKERTKELLREMIKQKITPRWMSQVRIDIAWDEELLTLMKESNCHYVYIGLESANPKTLKALNKGQTVEEIEKAIGIIKKAGIKTHGMFIFGADDDDRNTIKETLKFAKKIDLTTVQFLILTPLPGTPVFNKMEAEGRLISRDWGYYDAHHVVFKPKKISMFELQKETVRAMIRFYSIPRLFACLNRFDVITMAVRSYGYRMSKKAKKATKGFQNHLKEMYQSTETGLQSVSQNFQLKARKTTDDLKEFFGSVQWQEFVNGLKNKKALKNKVGKI